MAVQRLIDGPRACCMLTGMQQPAAPLRASEVDKLNSVRDYRRAMQHDGDSRPLEQRWEEDGFVVLRQFFTGAELREIQDHVQSSCEKARACWDPAVATPGGSGGSAGMLIAEQ